MSAIVHVGAFGHVHLVGAGPGDPDLLTLRAYRLIAEASIVAYDELVSAAILALIPSSAEKIPVGRRKGTCPNAPSIHPDVLARALAGHDIVRLKGGDPMIFGRGGEEAAELAALRIPFSIVPGISAALGAAASTGIPLTHRDAASAVTFATAQLRGGEMRSLLDRVPKEGTVVLYMGLSTLRELASRLILDNHRDASTPVAVVSHATLPDERTVTGTLETIADDVEREALPAPALVIIGDVVAHRSEPASAASVVRNARATRKSA
jgi:uroporphyrin-III C-methyltransferase